jgi:hypothetical protein
MSDNFLSRRRRDIQHDDIKDNDTHQSQNRVRFPAWNYADVNKL